MKVLNFKNNSEIETFRSSSIHFSFSKERTFLKFDSSISPEIKIKTLNHLSSFCTNIALCTNINEFIEIYFPLKNKSIIYFLEIENLTPVSINKNIQNQDLSHEDRAYQVHEINYKVNKYPDFEFSYILNLSNDNIALIDSIITVACGNKSIKEIIINQSLLDHSFTKIFKNKFDLIKAYTDIKKPIYFSPFNIDSEKWEASSKNPFRGPRYIDIDFSNFCTHNCVFCGLYNEETKRKISEKNFPEATLSKLYKGQISSESFYRIVQELPHNIKCMNIGGAGEPTSHPLFFEFLKELRLRNITINIFSHFAYMTPARIEELHELGNEDPNGLRFIINISAATADTYGKIRPNQSPEVFGKVISLLKLVSRKRTEAGRGIFFTYMSVTNALNYHEIPLMVFKAFEVGAHELWIKPIEAHGEEILKYLINDKHLLDYLINLKLGLYFADHLEVAIKHRYEIELVLTKHEKLISAHFINKSFNMHIKETLIRFPELEFTFTNNIKKQTNNRKIEISIEKFEVDLNSTDNIQNGGISNKLYDKAPCNIGYEYIRFGVNQEVWPCCIAKHPLSQDGANGILSNWHNDKLTNFRHITANFPQSKLHRIDNDWNFCQQCPHTLINEENYRLSEMN